MHLSRSDAQHKAAVATSTKSCLCSVLTILDRGITWARGGRLIWIVIPFLHLGPVAGISQHVALQRSLYALLSCMRPCMHTPLSTSALCKRTYAAACQLGLRHLADSKSAQLVMS